MLKFEYGSDFGRKYYFNVSLSWFKITKLLVWPRKPSKLGLLGLERELQTSLSKVLGLLNV